MKKSHAVHSIENLLLESGNGQLLALLDTESFTIEAQRLNGTLTFRHLNPEHDEVVICLNGLITITTPEGDIMLTAGEVAHIPRGLEHGPVIGHEAEILVLEGNR